MKSYLYLLMFIVILSAAYAEEKAVKNFVKGEGFELSAKAQKKMGISFLALKGKGPWKVPEEAVVNIKFSQGVYRRYENLITFVLVNSSRADDRSVWIESVDLQDGDEVAVEGMEFLRIVEADLNSETTDSCAH
jgi:hypothetical protein